MFRLNRITDYGIVLLADMASHAIDGSSRPHHSARELAENVDLPLPVVSKILKSLARGGIIDSHRGAKGGYRLSADHQEITVADMIAVLEGPVAMTACSASSGLCLLESSCSVRDPWQIINRVVKNALSEITLRDLVQFDPAAPSTFNRFFQNPQALPAPAPRSGPVTLKIGER